MTITETETLYSKKGRRYVPTYSLAHWNYEGDMMPVGSFRLVHAYLNVTWNYAKHYYRVFTPAPLRPGVDKYHANDGGTVGGIRSIYGLTGAESIPVLQSAIDQLGDDVHPDYWEPTEGNAKRSLTQLLALAQMRPDGVWNGD